MAVIKDLQPWLDYFDMLQVYEKQGFLEVMPDKYEAYITLPALFTLSTDKDAGVTSDDIAGLQRHLAGNIPGVVRRIRAYAGWKSQQGRSFLGHDFALHVVKDVRPHDLLYTFVLVRRKWLLRKKERIEIIDYSKP